MAKSGTVELEPPPLRNVRSLTGLRFLMSITVFISPIAVVLPVPPVNDVLGPAGSGGTFFLVLSGFALAWSFRGNDTRGRFMGRRMARIRPTMVIALAAPGTDAGHMIGAALASLFFVQAWIPGVVLETTDPVTWMLSGMVFFYALFCGPGGSCCGARCVGRPGSRWRSWHTAGPCASRSGSPAPERTTRSR